MLETLDRIVNATLFSIGGTTVTLSGVAAAILIVVIAFFAARLVGLAMQRARKKAKHGVGMLYLAEKLVTYGLVIAGIVSGLSTLGLDLSALAVFAGAIGIGIGLGLQDVVRQFISGLVLIIDRQINIGDYIELDSGRRGMVEEIGPRATRIRNNDNIDILVPNSDLIQYVVVNWTLRNAVRRIHIPFAVAYGSDKAKVRDAVLEAARAVPFTLPDEPDRKSQVWMVGFGDSSLNFELLVWPTLEACKRPNAMQAAYTWAIDDALRAAGVEIPFPQRDVRVRDLFGREKDEALRALGLDHPSEATQAAEPSAPSINDAAADLQRPLPTPQEDGDDTH